MSFFAELKRRNVIRVGVAYTVAAWLIAQVADLTADAFGAPDWFMRMLIVLLALGLPVALFLAWIYELTPDGVKLASDLPADTPKDPRSKQALNRITIAALVIAVAWLGWDKLQGPATDVAATVVDKSIAVLPFADFSPDGDYGWFADGLTDEILNALARTADLRVASRTSSFQYRGANEDVPRIASELGVAHILEGSVRRSGERLRVTAQLIRAGDDVHLWSESFDGTSEDSIRIQETIAHKIARALETAMEPDELERMLSAGTSSVEAWELYVRAEALINQDDTGFTGAESLRLLEQAVEIDPEFGDAYNAIAEFWLAHLSPSSTFRYDQPISYNEARQRFYDSLASAARYARSDAARAEYAALRARFDVRLNDFIAARQTISDLRPQNYVALGDLVNAYILVGNYAAARDIGLRARDLAMAANDPSSEVFQFLNRVDTPAALEMAEAAVNRPNVGAGDLYQAHRVFLYAGEVGRAAQIAQRHNDRETDASQVAMVNVRQACAEGRTADAEAAYARLLETISENESPNDWLFLKTLGRNNEADESIRHLDDSDSLYALSGYLSYTHFDPRPFPNLMARLQSQGITRPPPTTIPFACKR